VDTDAVIGGHRRGTDRPLRVPITWTVTAKITVPNRYETLACCNAETLIARLFNVVSVTP
jgi:hypothetical protein